MNMNLNRVRVAVAAIAISSSMSSWGGSVFGGGGGSGSGGSVFNFDSAPAVSNSAQVIPNTRTRVYADRPATVYVPPRNPTGSTYQPYTVLTPTGRYLMVPGADGSITTIIEVSRTRD
jgi:hypothetical protein